MIAMSSFQLLLTVKIKLTLAESPQKNGFKRDIPTSVSAHGNLHWLLISTFIGVIPSPPFQQYNCNFVRENDVI